MCSFVRSNKEPRRFVNRNPDTFTPFNSTTLLLTIPFHAPVTTRHPFTRVHPILTLKLRVRAREDSGHAVQSTGPPVILGITSLDNFDPVAGFEAKITVGLEGRGQRVSRNNNTEEGLRRYSPGVQSRTRPHRSQAEVPRMLPSS